MEAAVNAYKCLQATGKDFSTDLRQHCGQGRHTNHDAGGKETVEHQGFEFHGDSPFDEWVRLSRRGRAKSVPTTALAWKPH